jgi:hypothetical protein
LEKRLEARRYFHMKDFVRPKSVPIANGAQEARLTTSAAVPLCSVPLLSVNLWGYHWNCMECLHCSLFIGEGSGVKQNCGRVFGSFSGGHDSRDECRVSFFPSVSILVTTISVNFSRSCGDEQLLARGTPLLDWLLRSPFLSRLHSRSNRTQDRNVNVQ